MVTFGAHAADFPDRPVKLIIPWPSGGGTDTVGRVIGQQLATRWGQPVLVDNRGGASGSIGAAAAAAAPADGYTLLLATITLATNPSLSPNQQLDPLTDLTPLVLVAGVPHVLAVNPSVPAKNVAEFIAYAKSRPGKLNYASAGAGSPFHLAAELFNSAAGTRLVHVPYKGGAPAITDVIGGQAEVTFANIVAVMPHIASGRLRALGITSRTRSSAYPDIPTIAEQGLKDYEFLSWYGVLGPKGLPPALSAQISADIKEVLSSTPVQNRFKGEGAQMIATGPKEFASFISAETERWRQVVKATGMKAD